MSKSISIRELEKRDFNEYQYSKLVLELSGLNIDSSLINALRRTTMKHIPVYAISPNSIDIDENSSVFDNDYMRMRLSQIPIFNINTDILFLPQKFWKDVDYSDKKREKFKDDNLNLDLYINITNDNSLNLNVFSDSIEYMLDGEIVDDMLSSIHPILLIQLRPNEVFKAKLKPVLGLGDNSDIWSSVSNSYFEEIDSNNFKLTIESQGQIHEYNILVKSCMIIKTKLENIKNTLEEEIGNEEYKSNEIIELKIKNEDHTIGNIINEGLQYHDDIKFSGISKPDLLINEMVIKIITKSRDPLKPLNDVVDKYIDIFDNIESKLRVMGKKFI